MAITSIQQAYQQIKDNEAIAAHERARMSTLYKYLQPLENNEGTVEARFVLNTTVHNLEYDLGAESRNFLIDSVKAQLSGANATLQSAVSAMDEAYLYVDNWTTSAVSG